MLRAFRQIEMCGTCKGEQEGGGLGGKHLKRAAWFQERFSHASGECSSQSSSMDPGSLGFSTFGAGGDSVTWDIWGSSLVVSPL